MPELSIKQIVKNLGGLLTLNGINLQVENQAFVGILGPSGCGKSTLFNIISGLLPPDSGQVLIDGEDVAGCTGRVSYMQQQDLLLPSRNVLDNVSIPLLLKGMPKKAARAEARKHLATFGLAGFETYYPSQLSGGMRQRAALLRTHLFSSDIWLLDEPFASLDAITKRQMQAWLIGVYEQLQPTVLFITHDVDEALYLCDRIYVLSECPTVIKLEVVVPCSRALRNRTITDPEYGKVRDRILESLAGQPAGHIF